MKPHPATDILCCLCFALVVMAAIPLAVGALLGFWLADFTQRRFAKPKRAS